MPRLTDQQILFVGLYMSNGCDTLAAYKAAGYHSKHPEKNAWSIRRQPAVHAEIVRRMSKLTERSNMTQEEKLVRLEEIIRSPAETSLSRIAAIRTHNEMTGQDKPQPGHAVAPMNGSRVAALTPAELIEMANRNLMAMLPSRPTIVEIEAERE